MNKLRKKSNGTMRWKKQIFRAWWKNYRRRRNNVWDDDDDHDELKTKEKREMRDDHCKRADQLELRTVWMGRSRYRVESVACSVRETKAAWQVSKSSFSLCIGSGIIAIVNRVQKPTAAFTLAERGNAGSGNIFVLRSWIVQRQHIQAAPVHLRTC